MEIKKELFTPERASELLLRNLGNRNFRERVVDRYAIEMKAGRWLCDTGESIKLSMSGNLLDGQHRLMAIVKAGIPVEMHVCYGVSAEVFKVLDSGVPRSSGDCFYIKGIPYASMLPPLLINYVAIKSGTHKQNRQPTTTELLDLYNSNPEFWDEVATKTAHWYAEFGRILSTSIIGSCFALFYERNFDDSYKFMQQLCSGMNVNNKGIGLLRKKMIDDKLATRKMPNSIKLALVIKTWNYFRKQENIKMLKFNPEQESFPKAI